MVSQSQCLIIFGKTLKIQTELVSFILMMIKVHLEPSLWTTKKALQFEKAGVI